MVGYSRALLLKKLGLKSGMDAIDDDWSGLKFVYRLKDRTE